MPLNPGTRVGVYWFVRLCSPCILVCTRGSCILVCSLVCARVGFVYRRERAASIRRFSIFGTSPRPAPPARVFSHVGPRVNCGEGVRSNPAVIPDSTFLTLSSDQERGKTREEEGEGGAAGGCPVFRAWRQSRVTTQLPLGAPRCPGMPLNPATRVCP